MRSGLQRHQGVTLIEVMLVLVIGAVILLLSLDQYFVFRRDADVQQLKYNVDTLFQALSEYVQANCANTNPNNPTISNSPLNPRTTQGTAILSVSQLITAGYLKQSLPQSPLINYANSADGSGYYVQLNEIGSSTRTVAMSAGGHSLSAK